MEERKKDHIELAFRSRVGKEERDDRFWYEPLLKAHSTEPWTPFTFLGKTFRVPIWVSSMTGGTRMAHTINHNLARACGEFGMGMGLGSCRVLLDDDRAFPDFDVRGVMGDASPLYANLGIAQMEKFYLQKDFSRVKKLVEKLRADGLIIHVNPMQESLQPEGDRLTVPPIEVIAGAVEKLGCPVIVKEVGQGMGPESLRSLFRLPLEAIEFGAFGGTNFARLELMRTGGRQEELYGPLATVGHDAVEMVETVNRLLDEDPNPSCQQVIISGGIRNYLDGYALISSIRLPAVYGQAGEFLKHARGSYEEIRQYVEWQIRGLQLARDFLIVKK